MRDSPVVRGRLRALFAYDFGDEEGAGFVAANVALHDLGKLDQRFQMKASEAAVLLDPARASLRRVRTAYDHGSGGYRHARDEHRELFARLFGARAIELLLRATAAHHGEIPSKARTAEDDRYELEFHAAVGADRAARDQFLEEVGALFAARGAPLPYDREVTAAAGVWLAGLCAVADWVGSNVEFFAYVSELAPGVPGLRDYYESHALPRARDALIGLGLAPSRPSGKVFGELFPGLAPRGVQRLTTSLPLKEGPQLVVVEAPMGQGKTEAAFGVASEWLRRGEAEGLYVALPTQATSNAMFRRVVDLVPRLFDGGEVTVLLAHGEARRDALYRKLLRRCHGGGYGDGDRDEDCDATAVASAWFLSKKRSLLGQVGVGTVDQAMQAALRLRHFFVRSYGLASSVVVLDEVHAYDAFMLAIVERMVEWLGALRTPTLLLSATLPRERRDALAAAYRRGAGMPAVAANATLPSAAGSVYSGQSDDVKPAASPYAPYPLVTVASASGVDEYGPLEPPEDREVFVEVLAADDPAVAVAPRLIAAATAGAAVCWVRNTVREAQSAYRALIAAGATRAAVFHARFTAPDRAERELAVLEQFGKPSGAERRGRILVATQVVEQSLDLDFDWLVTDLAPIDLVLQRVGRLHRHERSRPAGFEAARLLVVSPPHDGVAGLKFGLSAYVYDPVTLWLAADSLRAATTLAMPGCIRPLVEASYGSAERAARLASAPNAAELSAAEGARVKKQRERAEKARRGCIPPSHLDFGHDPLVGDEDDIVEAMTRDGDSRSLLLVEWDGEELRSLDGASVGPLDPRRDDAFVVAKRLADGMVRVPRYPGEAEVTGSRPRGEARAWASVEEKITSLLASFRLGREVVVVPMRRATVGDGFVGYLQRGAKRVRVTYDKQLGFVDREETE